MYFVFCGLPAFHLRLSCVGEDELRGVVTLTALAVGAAYMMVVSGCSHPPPRFAKLGGTEAVFMQDRYTCIQQSPRGGERLRRIFRSNRKPWGVHVLHGCERIPTRPEWGFHGASRHRDTNGRIGGRGVNRKSQPILLTSLAIGHLVLFIERPSPE